MARTKKFPTESSKRGQSSNPAKFVSSVVSDLQFPSPWVAVKDSAKNSIIAELKSEVSRDHTLFKFITKYDNAINGYVYGSIKPLAQSGGKKVLFELPSSKRFAVVALTWSGRNHGLSGLPATKIYDSLNQIFTAPDIIQHPIPALSLRNAEPPFLKHFDTFQNTDGKFHFGTRFYSLDENNLQKYSASSKAKKLIKPSAKKQKKLIEKLHRHKILSVIYQHCRNGAEDLTMVFGNHTLSHCEKIAMLAADGNKNAILSLAEIAILATKVLEKVVSSNYSLLTNLAAYEYAWPVMRSPLTSLSSTIPDWKALGLGSAFGFNFNPKRRLQLHTPVGKFAWLLLNYVIDLKRLSISQARGLANSEKMAESTKRKIILEDHGASELPDFNSSNYSKWWVVAKKCLISACPNPDDSKELNENHPMLTNLITAQSHRKTPKIRRAHIFEKLEEQFGSIAGAPRVKQKIKPH